jgi:hypothetical protein
LGSYKLDRIIILIVFFLISCTKVQPIRVIGDIPLHTYVSSLDDLKKLNSKYEISNILLIGEDGVSVEISPSSISELFLRWDKAWNLDSETLPSFIKIKNLSKIAVESNYLNHSFAHYDGFDYKNFITNYDYILLNSEFIGSADKNNHKVNKYITNINNGYFHDITSDSLLVIFSSGQEMYIENNKFTDIKFNLDCWTLDDSHVSIIWEDSPISSLNDLSNIISDQSHKNSLLLICLDGFGYFMWENLVNSNHHCYLTTLNFKPTRAIYPPKTKTSLSVIGKETNNNLFNHLNFSNGVIIEEDKAFYTSKYDIILNNKNDSINIDESIFYKAIEYLENSFNFVFVHFHSIDDTAHKYGTYSLETIKAILQVSEYVEELMKKSSNTIIFSDHGLHNSKFSGIHGTNRLEDMLALYYIEEL